MVTHVLHALRFVSEVSKFEELFGNSEDDETSTFVWPNWNDVAFIPSSSMLSKYLQVYNNYEVLSLYIYEEEFYSTALHVMTCLNRIHSILQLSNRSFD